MFFNLTTDFVGEKSTEYLDREIPFWNMDDPKELREYLSRSFSRERHNRPSFKFDRYYQLADFMTKAYSGQYVYEKKPGDFKERAVRKLIDDDNYLALCVPKSFGLPILWHAFDLCSRETITKKNWIVNYDLIPLNPRDPLVGGEKPLMHYPLDVIDLANYASSPSKWRDFSNDEWQEYNSRVNTFRLGKLIEFLCIRQGKNKKIVKDLWEKIESYNREYSDYLLKRKNVTNIGIEWSRARRKD
jgi:hypothetical protein